MFLRRKFPQSKQAQSQSEMADVLNNLNVLLNARRGAGSFDECFGLDTTAYRSHAEAAEILQRQVRENIEEYEPRLNVLSIEEEYNDEGKPFIEVLCELRSSGEVLKIKSSTDRGKFETMPFDPMLERE